MSNLTTFFVFLLLSIALFIGILILVKKWTRFHKSIFGIALKILYFSVLSIGIFIYANIAYNSLNQYLEDDRLILINSFEGISLGWSKDDVYFRKGKPQNEEVIDKQTEFLDYGKLGVKISNNKVIKIIHLCDADNHDYRKVGGIQCGADIEKILKKYGEPQVISGSDDKLSRAYNYPKYNIAYVLSKSEVVLLGVFDPKNAPSGLAFSRKNAEIKPNKDKNFPWNNPAWKKKKDSISADNEANTESESEEITNEIGDAANSSKRYRLLDEPSLDHCAPDINKSERLRRLALKGNVRETGYQTYSANGYEITFSDNRVISCR